MLLLLPKRWRNSLPCQRINCEHFQLYHFLKRYHQHTFGSIGAGSCSLLCSEHYSTSKSIALSGSSNTSIGISRQSWTASKPFAAALSGTLHSVNVWHLSFGRRESSRFYGKTNCAITQRLVLDFIAFLIYATRLSSKKRIKEKATKVLCLQ